MDHTLIWISFCFGFGFSTFPTYNYFYVDTRVDFASAQTCCRQYYKDVATITSRTDMSMMVRPSTNQEGVWIGLNDDPTDWKGVMGNNTNSWRWSLTGQTSKTSYCNWQPGQPDFAGAMETCVVANPYGQWVDVNCNIKYWSICTVTNATGKLFVLVQTMLTWTGAQTYCRQIHMDLATIENTGDSQVVTSINLRQNFAVGKPDNSQWVNFCVAELPDHTWTDTPCSSNLAFFCYDDSKLKTVLSIRSQTNADMTDPAINVQILQQIEAALQNQGATVFQINWSIQPRKV